LPSGISPQCQCGWFSKEFVTSLHFDLIKACFVAGLFTGCFVCLFIYIYSLTSLAGLYICLMIAHIICLKKKKKFIIEFVGSNVGSINPKIHLKMGEWSLHSLCTTMIQHRGTLGWDPMCGPLSNVPWCCVIVVDCEYFDHFS
jgi:hypothetical protein